MQKGASKDLWSILGVEKTADEAEIKRGYRKAALRTHPDKNGNAEEFALVNEAYEILSNANLKRIYELRGLQAARQALKSNGNGGASEQHQQHSFVFHSFSDIFANMGVPMSFTFGNGQGGPFGQMPRSAHVTVTLEQIYCAETIKVNIPATEEIKESSQVELTIDSLAHFCNGSKVCRLSARDALGPVLINLELKESSTFLIAGPKHLVYVEKITLCKALTGHTVKFRLPDKQKTLVTVSFDGEQVITPETQRDLPEMENGWRIALRFDIRFPNKGWSDHRQRETVKELFEKLQ